MKKIICASVTLLLITAQSWNGYSDPQFTTSPSTNAQPIPSGGLKGMNFVKKCAAGLPNSVSRSEIYTVVKAGPDKETILRFAGTQKTDTTSSAHVNLNNPEDLQKIAGFFIASQTTFPNHTSIPNFGNCPQTALIEYQVKNLEYPTLYPPKNLTATYLPESSSGSCSYNFEFTSVQIASIFQQLVYGGRNFELNAEICLSQDGHQWSETFNLIVLGGNVNVPLLVNIPPFIEPDLEKVGVSIWTHINLWSGIQPVFNE